MKGSLPGTSAMSKVSKNRKAFKIFCFVILFAGIAGLCYVSAKLYKLRKERQEEKKSALIEEGDFEDEDDEEDSNSRRNEGGSFASAS